LGDGAVVAAFWDDLFIFAGTTQNIYYEIDGNTVTVRSDADLNIGIADKSASQVEYLVSHISFSDRIYHFSAFYDANVPGVVQVKYYQMSEGGSSATIGMQNGKPITLGREKGMKDLADAITFAQPPERPWSTSRIIRMSSQLEHSLRSTQTPTQSLPDASNFATYRPYTRPFLRDLRIICFFFFRGCMSRDYLAFRACPFFIRVIE